MKHNRKMEAVNTIQEHKPNYVMQAARRWRGQMALALLSLGKVPVHPPCKAPLCLLPSKQYRQDSHAHCRQNSPSCSGPALPQPGLREQRSASEER